MHAKVSFAIVISSPEVNTDISRQRREGTDVLYSFLVKLQFWALAGSTAQSGSSSCFSGEEAMLFASVSVVLGSMVPRLFLQVFSTSL